MKVKTTCYELPGLKGKYDSLRTALSGDAVSISEVDPYFLPVDAKGEKLLMPDGIAVQIENLSSGLVRISVSTTDREPKYITEIVKRYGWERPKSSGERLLRPDQRLEQILEKK